MDIQLCLETELSEVDQFPNWGMDISWLPPRLEYSEVDQIPNLCGMDIIGCCRDGVE